MMTFLEKCEAVRVAPAAMESSKMLCLDDAVRLFQCGDKAAAEARLEKAAQYAWGSDRPVVWFDKEPVWPPVPMPPRRRRRS